MTKKAKAKLPETATAAELAELAGLTERRIQQFAEAGTIPKPAERGGYLLRESLVALFAYYRELANGLPAQTASDKARQAKADADSSQVRAGKEVGQLMYVSDARRFWASGFVQIREMVLRSGLTAKQKQELCETFKKLKLPEIDA